MTTRNGRRFALPILQGTIAVAIAGTVLTLSGRPLGGAQATPPPTARPAEWAQRSRNFEQTGLAEPFKGITADGDRRAEPLRGALDRRLHRARRHRRQRLSGARSPSRSARRPSSRSTIPNGASG